MTTKPPVSAFTPVGLWVACILLVMVLSATASSAIGAGSDHSEDMIVACSQIPYYELPDVCDPYLEAEDAE